MKHLIKINGEQFYYSLTIQADGSEFTDILPYEGNDPSKFNDLDEESFGQIWLQIPVAPVRDSGESIDDYLARVEKWEQSEEWDNIEIEF